MSYRGREQYRKNDCRFQWRCAPEDRQNLKKAAADTGKTMNELLTLAWNYYNCEVLKNDSQASRT